MISDTSTNHHGNGNNARLLSSSCEQWKLPLQEVKLLHLLRRHKQCASRAIEVLNESDTQLHSIHRAYLNYYCAASYETLGRAAHNFSSNKLPLLRMAKDNYATCGTFLETAFITLSQEEEEEEWDISSDEGALDFSSSTISANSWEWRIGNTDSNTSGSVRQFSLWSNSTRSRPSDSWDSPTPPPLSLPLKWGESHQSAQCERESGSPGLSMVGHKEGNSNSDLIPSPLSIRKSGYLDVADLFPIPSRPLPKPPIHTLQVNGYDRAPTANNNDDPFNITYESKRDTSQGYNTVKNRITRMLNLISSLSEQIDENIHVVSNLIEKTTDLQRIHNATKITRFASFWSFTPTYTTSSNSTNGKTCATDMKGSGRINGNSETSNPGEETKQQRIARLKAEGWKTVGIKSPSRGWKGTRYYERLCSEALAELYGI